MTDSTRMEGQYGVFTLGGWQLWLAATPKGLRYVGTETSWGAWGQRRGFVRDDERLKPYADELEAYFRGERERLTLPVDAGGTPFQQVVWQALGNIPPGGTTSYSAIAETIGRPSAVRAVAAAIGANPVLIYVPCHRVVGKNGALTGFREGLEMKRRLLELESNAARVGASAETT